MSSVYIEEAVRQTVQLKEKEQSNSKCTGYKIAYSCRANICIHEHTTLSMLAWLSLIMDAWASLSNTVRRAFLE